MANTVTDNEGNSKNGIAFVFACPGRREEKHHIVCYGATGTNLNKLLTKLNEIDPDAFVSLNRYDYTIINSCTTVYPNNENPSKTEPDSDEIDDEDNLERIHTLLKGKDFVICFGNSAEHAIDSVKKKYDDVAFEAIMADHLSPSNLNRNYTSDKETPKDRNIDRILQASKPIIEFLERQKK